MINEIKLEGRLVSDPQIVLTRTGSKLARFTIANPRTSEITDFIDCNAWDNEGNELATELEKVAHKGTLIKVSGRIQKDKNVLLGGKVYYNVYITVSSFEVE